MKLSWLKKIDIQNQANTLYMNQAESFLKNMPQNINNTSINLNHNNYSISNKEIDNSNMIDQNNNIFKQKYTTDSISVASAMKALQDKIKNLENQNAFLIEKDKIDQSEMITNLHNNYKNELINMESNYKNNEEN